MEKSVRNNKRLISHEGGFLMIEAVIGVILASILLTAFLSLNVQATKLNRVNENNFRASMYLKELIEIAKDLELTKTPTSWSEIVNCVDINKRCKPFQNMNTWELDIIEDINNPDKYENIENKYFKRWIIVENVCRDNYVINHFEFPNNIIDCIIPSNIDPETKKITAHIEWNDGTLHEMELETYVYNY